MQMWVEAKAEASIIVTESIRTHLFSCSSSSTAGSAEYRLEPVSLAVDSLIHGQTLGVMG